MRDILIEMQFIALGMLCLTLLVCLCISAIPVLQLIAIKGIIYSFIGIVILILTILFTTID